MVFRKGSHIVDLYNSGLFVFLYDLAHAAAIQKADPDILHGFGGGWEKRDRKLKEVTAKALMVAYELDQDSGRDIEIAVGPPLSAKEKKQAAWLREQKALLDLPSGRLRVESYDTLRLTEEWDSTVEHYRKYYGTRPEHEGVTVKVPAGHYLLTLHRLDWEGLDSPLEDDDPDVGSSLEEGEGMPSEVITLTPRTTLRPLKVASALLLYPTRFRR